MLGEKVDEGAHPRGQRRCVTDIDGVDVLAVAGIVVLKNRNKMSGLDVGADVEEGETGKADAAERKAAGYLAVAGARGRRRHGFLGAVAALERPAADRARKRPADAAVIGEIRRRLRRARACEVIRRADDDHAAGAEFARDEA